MEILLELGEYKRSVTISQGDDLLVTVASEMKDQLAKLGGPAASGPSVSLARGEGDFFLQVYSNKWATFVDVEDSNNITDGDRVKIIKRCTAEVSCNAYTLLSLVLCTSL